ncbi:DNA-processing protein DprA [Agromyces italicus]|uniref:DNA-processing protein DprA n=1 Tax=Agromyces italicus TaxID=279572 RepID=UPI00041CBFF4|nr:DNA-processing protein DprA [Agromyces italicus]
MTADDERATRMTLATVSEPADIITGALVIRIGAAETLALLESRSALPPGIDPAEGELWRRRLAARLNPASNDEIEARMAQHDLRMIMPGDVAWSAELSQLGPSAPLALWLKGDSTRLTTQLSERVTIVGSRAATSYGDRITADLSTNLARRGKVIVTGGAYGIDAAAIRAATATAPGHTIAVLAGGLDRPYPSGHDDLFTRVTESGGLLISELPPGAAPTRWRFLQRGRLVAALGSATIVVEAGQRSSALNVAAFAHALGRPVAATPGPLTSPASAGTHRLIQDGVATLVVGADDVLALTDPAVRYAAERPFAYSPARGIRISTDLAR